MDQLKIKSEEARGYLGHGIAQFFKKKGLDAEVVVNDFEASDGKNGRFVIHVDADINLRGKGQLYKYILLSLLR